ncbi:alpha/beta fold hydrolase [Mucilaginibacter phyllosphaerae]|uniref:Alpha/beta hydrolase n=1 Tax=Mucilaginibacter phyllosphaerae TaxID=1812349 RepID=A0A4Y8ABG6_9SPHI|nr:alpha/beta hydrolase [Mucilaginibacter phyllosphaerae]MBB3969330.1 sigma-B regulation protein RsbQ [Mucilaginibacter phyllosphaerae]TEW65877.1 alpha/beta hydrolase [Mucilaginibacter phyllosphaerae]GGH07741.1 hydrolase [Mucilaginibacter phyllosphaerae]
MSPTLKKKNNITVEGNPDTSRTIVFSNGFGTDKSAWDVVKQAFSQDYRMVLYDNVGGGNADPNAYSPIKYSSLNAYADDLLDIAADLDLENAVMVAHSVSSMITMLASVKDPKYFSKVVFIGASPRYLNDESANYTGGFTQPALDSMYNTMTTNYYAWVSGFSSMAMGNPDNPELGESFARTLAAIRPDVALAVSKVIFESDVRKELDNYRKETLLIQAQNDIAVPDAVAQYLNKNISNNKLRYVDAEGHFPHISAPQEVIAAIKSFI